jgi:hypothetical protein
MEEFRMTDMTLIEPFTPDGKTEIDYVELYKLHQDSTLVARIRRIIDNSTAADEGYILSEIKAELEART